ncbi:ATP-binding protein [Kitasatospora sp. NPDC093806]|uniref:ATP-binding protein n=1 Tax=Kitasatospora sp. NPDC093806 TaxID=3155075 RepID=UPI00344AE0C1
MPGTDRPAHHPFGARDSWFPRSRRSPQLARQLLRELLDEWPGGERFVEAGELLTSELVGNAVLHSGMPGRLIRVFFDVDDDRLRIEAHDAGERLPIPRYPTTEDTRGRGLLLVDALCLKWGYAARPDGIGKVVWCECGPWPLTAE